MITINELNKILYQAYCLHAWPSSGRKIKYVRPYIDNRSGLCYGVVFECVGGTVEFFVVNENKHKNLGQWVWEWMSEAEKE
jgi:hypothetical protein